MRPTLQIEGHDDLFAVGDCASLDGHPDLPKAGVYAVREGPVLVDNLRARLVGAALSDYDAAARLPLAPQPRRRAGHRLEVGLAAEGRALFRLKDWIDRRFMRRFQVLDEDGDDHPGLRGVGRHGFGGEMLCGGCAAKVGESVLSRALARIGAPADPSVLVGLAERDDVAAVASERGEVVVSTVDSFRAFTDDPYLVGKVAAVNAMSDLWAKGVAPRFALAQVSVPEDEA